MKWKSWLSAVALVLASGSALQAQKAPVVLAADSALASCAAAAEAKNESESASKAELANKLYDQAIGAGGLVADAYAGKARVISQCRIPFAAMLRKGALIEDSNELLQHALALDSLHFGARFTLALNHYYVPEFMGRTDDAVRELEKLVAYFGNRAIPQMATVYLFLGDVYLRKGRKADAVAVWQRGQKAFPASAEKFLLRIENGSGSGSGNGSGNGNGNGTAIRTGSSQFPVYEHSALIVESGRFSVDDTRGSASLKRMDIVTMPGGTADVLQVFQTMPGVTRATEGSDLYVRGGDAAEAPVFIDGARMTYAGAFETLHGGIFGVLDPNSIKKADFSSGGFSARFGNALSGVLDITSEGRPQARSFRAGANLVSAGSTYRTPLGNSAGLWLTGKATETSALLWTQGRSADYPRKPWSLSGMAGLTMTPTPRIEIKATALSEADAASRVVDVLGYTGTLRSTGGTHMALLSARAMDSGATRSLRTSLSAARRATTFDLGILNRERHDDMYTARIDADMMASNAIRLRAGVEGAALRADEDGTVPVGPELAPGSSYQVIDALAPNGSHIGGYIETEINVSPRFAFIAGNRADKLAATDAWTMDPRLAIAFRTDGWTLRSGAGVFHQSAWRNGYRTPNPGAPSDVATRARHFVIGVEREAPVHFRIEAFAKAYDEYAAVAGTTSPEMVVQGPEIDRGRNLGVDALVRWKASGALSGWASYSYLDGRVRVRETREWVASAQDVHHTFTGVAKLAVGDNWEIGTTARLASGRPFTPIIGSQINTDGSRSAVYGDTHAQRLPDYARLDTRLTRLVPSGNGLLVFYIEGLNLLDRRNVMAYTYDSSYTRRIPVDSFFASRTLVFGAEAMF